MMQADDESGLRAAIQAVPAMAHGARLWVAYSGGLDSTVLLHLLAASGARGLCAVHVNHGLQSAAVDWERHCRDECERLGVSLEILRVTVAGAGHGTEAAARQARYDAIRRCLLPGDVLATAHHRDDQAETVLLRMLRGSHVRGLAAMRELAPFAPGQIWRPLLPHPRASLRAYADRQDLCWIEDPHNADPRFARSMLRTELLPRLTATWPATNQKLAAVAEACAEAAALMDELAASDFREVVDPGDADGPHMLRIRPLLALTPPRRRNLLRWWIERLGLPLPDADTLRRVDEEVLKARQDAGPRLTWPGGELRRYRDQLHPFAGLPDPDPDFRRVWDGRQSLNLPDGCGVLSCRGCAGEPVWTVCFAKGGERMRSPPSGRHRRLKNLFQEHGVPPWVRERTPLLFENGELRWIGGIGWSHPAPSSMVIEWRPGAVSRTQAGHNNLEEEW
jgi:tRNA(Ile)-lysidine synthase